MTTKKETPFHPAVRFNPDRLLAIIEFQEKSVSEIADSTGTSRTIMYKWINGEQVPKLKSIIAMCEYFNIPIGYFFPTGKRLKPERSRPEPALVS